MVKNDHLIVDKIFVLSKLKVLADNNFNVAKMLQFLLEGWKILWEKEKMLVSSIFSFSHNVFSFNRLLSTGLLKVRIVCFKELMRLYGIKQFSFLEKLTEYLGKFVFF